jgi:hypothetical protein
VSVERNERELFIVARDRTEDLEEQPAGAPPLRRGVLRCHATPTRAHAIVERAGKAAPAMLSLALQRARRR